MPLLNWELDMVIIICIGMKAPYIFRGGKR